jgi:CBS domain-containing protein
LVKTSVIRFRVADFLKQHAPFNEIPAESLLLLAASGRVIFHESDEFVFRKNQICGPAIWVIQQGSVSLIEDTPQGEQLRDLLSEGDILGSERLLGIANYRSSARTSSDVILYSIDADQFAKVSVGNAAVTRYLAANLSVEQGHVENAIAANLEIVPGCAEKRTWLDAPASAIELLQKRLLTIGVSETVRVAALQMSQAHSDWIAVTGENGQPLGLITLRELCDHAASGSSPEAPASTIMNSRLPISSPDLAAGNYFLQMMKTRSRQLAITLDGTAASVLQGVITDSDLSLSSGVNPALLVLRMIEATTPADWKRLLQLAERILRGALTGPATVDACSAIGSEFLHATLESVLRKAQLDLPNESAPRCCWLLFSRGGRADAVLPAQPEIAVVYDDSSENAEAQSYFSAVRAKAAAYLAQCGLRVPESDTPLCQSLGEWKQFFESCVADPIGNAVHRNRALFDFHSIYGDLRLAQELHQAIVVELEKPGPFIPIMANDTLSNLPPLTFFHGLVVELDGAQRETLDIKSTALDPITDAARVFALSGGDLEVSNTLARLGQAAKRFPSHSAMFEAASQAFRVATYQQAIAGQGGALIRPSLLTRYDQRLLKTAFDAIQRLLELSSTTFNIAA